MLKRKIVQNRQLASCTLLARLLFVYSMTHTDIEGRWYGEPRIWRSQLLPWDDDTDITTRDVAAAMQELEDARDEDGIPLVQFYSFRGTRYCAFPRFGDNQILRPDREAATELPAPPEEALIEPPEGSRGDTTNDPPEDSRSTPGTREVKEKGNLSEGKVKISQLPPGDREVLKTWMGVAGFSDKMTLRRAVELLAKIREEFPDLDVTEESSKWAANKIGRPMTAKSNPSLQLYNWMHNAVKYKKEKETEDDLRKNRRNQAGATMDRTRSGAYSRVKTIKSGTDDCTDLPGMR
jgi:hypothetical protein